MKTKYTVLIGIIGILLVSSCRNGIFCKKGEGVMFTQTRTVSEFNKVVLEIDANLHIRQSDTASVEIVAQEAVLNEIQLDISRNKMTISYDKCIGKHDGVDIYIATNEINEITISGSGEIISEEPLEVEELDLIVNGSGNMYFKNLSVSNQLNTQINSSGKIIIKSNDTTMLHNIDISSSGSIEAVEFYTSQTKAKITGSGDMTVWVIDELDVSIKGSGNVYYKGYPSIISNITGSGKLINFN